MLGWSEGESWGKPKVWGMRGYSKGEPGSEGGPGEGGE